MYSEKGATHNKCLPLFGMDRACAATHYDPIMHTIITKSKYNLSSDLLINVLKKIPRSWWHIERIQREVNVSDLVLQPIPLHPSREKLRGFNQAVIIANHLQSIFSIPYIQALMRTKNTLPQAQEKDRKERARNMRDAFSWDTKTNLSGKTVILIDDVYTTGFTAHWASYTLKKHAGARHVYICALSHGRPYCKSTKRGV